MEIKKNIFTDADTKIYSQKISEIDVNIIENQLKWYKAKDIAMCLGAKDLKKVVKLNVSEKNIKILGDFYKLSTFYGNSKNTKYINKDGIFQILTKTRSFMPQKIQQISDAVDLKINIANNIILSKEQNELGKILKVFGHYKYKLQYRVITYKVDLYFTDLNLAIECDENGHDGYLDNGEKNREKIIKEQLNCMFIRFNPDDEKYDVLDLIKNIHDYIINWKNTNINLQ